MAGKQGLQERMRREIRRREARPRQHAVPTGNVRSDRWDEITRYHPDVLQNIEVAIVDTWREIGGLDDAWTHLALVAAMRNDPPDHPTSWWLFSRLLALRSLRDDVPDDLWLDALRVVDQSVRDHSSLRHGEQSYLEFIRPYVAPAGGGVERGT